MSESSLRVVARIKALPDTVAETRSILLELIAPTREESGCVVYELLQNTNDPTDFTFVEEWESDAALDTHLASAHINQAVLKLDGLLAEATDIRRYSLLK